MVSSLDGLGVAPHGTAAAIVDRDGRIVAWSGEAEDLLGFAVGEVLEAR